MLSLGSVWNFCACARVLPGSPVSSYFPQTIWIGGLAILNCPSVWMCVHRALCWTTVPSRVYSHPAKCFWDRPWVHLQACFFVFFFYRQVETRHWRTQRTWQEQTKFHTDINVSSGSNCGPGSPDAAGLPDVWVFWYTLKYQQKLTPGNAALPFTSSNVLDGWLLVIESWLGVSRFVACTFL